MSAPTRQQPPKRPKKPDPLPATGTTRDAPHFGRAVAGCACMSCATHRVLAHRDAELERLVARYADEPVVEGSVLVAPNATAEFAAAVHGRQEP